LLTRAIFSSTGDSITIASSEELVDACEQYVGQKVLRITTYVKPKTTAPHTVGGAPEKKCPPPSVDRGTSTSHSPPIQIQDVLESFVGVLSTAVHHLQEGLVAKSARNPTPSADPAAIQMKSSDDKALAEETSDKKLEESVSENQEEVLADDQKPATDLTTDEEIEGTSHTFIHGRHTCDSCLSTPIIGTRYHSTNVSFAFVVFGFLSSFVRFFADPSVWFSLFALSSRTTIFAKIATATTKAKKLCLNLPNWSVIV
jgi:hypothetical protein